jgi:hypothetical protein
MYDNLIRLKTQTTAAVREPTLLELLQQVNQGVQYLLVNKERIVGWRK